MTRAFAEKDPSFDGVFFVGVKTTGIFCRPVCRAKPARASNLEFFASAAAAARHGYRPCKLCRPAVCVAPVPLVVNRLMQLANRTGPITGRELRRLGVSETTARRRFREYSGMTFAQYQRTRRLSGAMAEVRKGRSAGRAAAVAGFSSRSGFDDAFSRLFGADARQQPARNVKMLAAARFPTPLGTMLAVAGDEGLVLLEFPGKDEFSGAIDQLRQRFATSAGPAVIVPADHPILTQARRELAEYFLGTRKTFTTKLAPRGTPFQQQAWDYLRTIPFGQTRSYGDQARGIDRPQAVRAVGRANGCNTIAIMIPCHRVIGANGSLTGFAAGLARKAWLLRHEQNALRGNSIES